jgi:hypothetical protein
MAPAALIAAEEDSSRESRRDQSGCTTEVISAAISAIV